MFITHFVVFVFSLDPEQKDYLIEVIEKLLKDKTTVCALKMFAIKNTDPSCL